MNTIDENSTLVEVLQDVGDAVREKGVSGEWKGYQLPSAVRAIRNDPVYDSRVTIQVNGVANGSFTVNQSSDSTINLQTLTLDQVSAIMPSKTSELTNDSGFITEDDVADKRDYNDLTVQNQIDMPPYYNISTVTFTWGVGQAVMNAFWIDADENRCWFSNAWFDRQLKTRDGQTFQLVWSDHFTETLTLKQLKEGYTFEKDGQTYSISATFGRGYEKMSVSWEGLGYNLYLNKFAVIDDADKYNNTWVVWYDGDLDDTSSAPCWYIRQTFSPGSSTTSTQGIGSQYQLYYRYNGQDVFVGHFTDESKMTRDTEWHETWTYEDHEGQTITRNYTIMATRNWDNLALESNLEIVSASVSAMSSQIDLTNSHVSALESRMGDVSASVSSLESSVETIGSSVDAVSSQVSAMASNFNVSGIGCSTIVLSGTYADSTSFAFNVVVQPSA